MYLLDTTHCLAALFGLPDISNKIQDLSKSKPSESRLSASVITRCELVYGAFKSERFNSNLQRIEIFFQDLIIYPIDETTADVCAKLKFSIIERFGPKLKSKLRNTSTDSLGFKDNDLWIASTAIQYGLILVSADSDLLRLDGIEDLRIENW